MTPEEAAAKMKSIADGTFYVGQTYSDGTQRLYDAENQHGDADELMCELLRSLGYEDMVETFVEMPKWYA